MSTTYESTEQPSANEQASAPNERYDGPPLPPMDWEAFIAQWIQRNVNYLTQTAHSPERVAEITANQRELVRKRFLEWQALGNHLADTLNDPDISRELQEALWDEIDALMDDVQLNFSDPEYRVCDSFLTSAAKSFIFNSGIFTFAQIRRNHGQKALKTKGEKRVAHSVRSCFECSTR